jgi:hypothetical protein
LLLLGSIEQTEGNLERARRRTVEARNEFERAGHRLGIAQSDLAIAQIEYRLCDFHSAERGAIDALGIFEALSTPRHQANCERLLAMVCVDLDELESAAEHAQQAARLFRTIGEPSGQVEANLLLAQAGLVARNPTEARDLLTDARRIEVIEPEVKQHQLLTEAWYEVDTLALEEASARVCSAYALFEEHQRIADHTAQLLARLSRTQLSAKALDTVSRWRRLIAERNRRLRD